MTSERAAAGYLHIKDQQPNPRRMCRRGCVEYPDGEWTLCAWHEEKAQWAARETHRHDSTACSQCAALAAARGEPEIDVERLASGIAYAMVRTALPGSDETSRDYANRLAPLVIESGYLATPTAPGPGDDA